MSSDLIYCNLTWSKRGVTTTVTSIMCVLQWRPLGAEQMSFSVVMGSALERRSDAIATTTVGMELMSLTVVSGEGEEWRSRVADRHARPTARLYAVARSYSSYAWLQLGFVDFCRFVHSSDPSNFSTFVANNKPECQKRKNKHLLECFYCLLAKLSYEMKFTVCASCKTCDYGNASFSSFYC